MVDDFDVIAFNDASGFLSGIVPQVHRNPVYFMAALISGGFVTNAQIDEARIVVAKKRAIEDAEKQKRAAEWQKKQAAEREPDVLFPKLFKRRNSDFVSLQNWIEKTPTVELEKLLLQLTTRTQHWSSLYFGKIGEAIEYLESAIEKKKGVSKKR